MSSDLDLPGVSFRLCIFDRSTMMILCSCYILSNGIVIFTVAYQASPSMRFSRQEYWSGLPFPSPEDLPDPGIEPRSPALWADALSSEPPGKPWYVKEHNKFLEEKG